jgi:hypothetical protein
VTVMVHWPKGRAEKTKTGIFSPKCNPPGSTFKLYPTELNIN